MELIELKRMESDEEQWDRIVDESSKSTIFHTVKWKKVIENTYNLKSRYYFIKDIENKAGLIPFFEFKNLKQKNILVSLPYCQEGGAITDNNALEIYNRFSQNNTIFLKERAKEASGKKTLTMVVNLPSDSKSLLKKFNQRTRQYCNKSAVYALNLKTKDVTLEDFYKIYSENMKRLGTPAHGMEFYHNIIKYFGDDAKLWALIYKNEIISVIFLLLFKNIVYNLHALSRKEFEFIRPSIVINWFAMKTVTDMGYNLFDFGRSTLNKGTYDFKKRFGAEEIFFDYYYLKSKMRIETGVPQPGLASRIWMKLPRKITNNLGPKIRKFVP